ncbi:GTP pyrophosphokinase family protein [Microbacteriaceae bacterium VKM Ac-2854]|nr:GTP pyrophosphokinase family protein [Microbacteriaceae bacterium VKM Ac-2854]
MQAPILEGGFDGAQIDAATVAEIRAVRDDFARFMLQYKFGMDEIVTKVSILQEEFAELHDYNPIEHVSSRLKSADSLIEKIERKGCDPTFDGIAASITDIAGVRITCSFVSDVYRVFDLLTSQSDVTVIEVKDYIEQPKENGYKSLHAIVQVPVFLSGGIVDVRVEVQFRTIAMDFWASLEHKIYYKYARQVPQELLDGLRDAAATAASLDADMERLHRQVRAFPAPGAVPRVTSL